MILEIACSDEVRLSVRVSAGDTLELIGIDPGAGILGNVLFDRRPAMLFPEAVTASEFSDELARVSEVIYRRNADLDVFDSWMRKFQIHYDRSPDKPAPLNGRFVSLKRDDAGQDPIWSGVVEDVIVLFR